MKDKLEEYIYDLLQDHYADAPIQFDDDFPDFADTHWEEGKSLLIEYIKENL